MAGGAIQLAMKRKTRSWSWIVFASCLGIYLVAVYLVPIHLRLFEPDAMWYSVQSWLVLSGHLFRLSLFSSPEPPLLVILQLPLAFWPDFQQDGLSGGLISALAGALACGALHAFLIRQGIGAGRRIPVLTMFALNPLVLYYCGTGSFVMTWLLLILLSALLLTSWAQTTNLQPVISLGFTLGAASLVRYDALFYCSVLLAVLGLLAVSMPNRSLEQLLGLLITCLAPVLFLLGAWLVLSLLISFGPYSLMPKEEIGFAAAVASPTGLAASAPWSGDTAGSVLEAPWSPLGPFPFFVVGLIALLADGLLTGDRVSRSLAALAMTFPALWLLRDLLGMGAPSLHDTVSTIPFGFLMAGQLLVRIEAAMANRYVASQLATGAVLLSLGLSTAATGASLFYWLHPGPASRPPIGGSASLEPSSQREMEQSVANYLLQHADNGRVLIDDREGYRIIFFSARPELFVTRGTPGFASALRSPVGLVDYLVVRNPQAARGQDTINGYYPALYELGAPWAELVTETGLGDGVWRLYKVAKPSDIDRRALFTTSANPHQR